MNTPSVATPISAVLITLNSERLLGSVLDALQWCAEIVVVDSGSTDSTLQIARERGARVLHRDFDGFGPQKRFAVAQAVHDWVLVVDADEVVTPELRAEIQNRVGREEGVVGYNVPISLIFMERLMRYGSEYKMPHLRLFNRTFGTYNLSHVHEDVELSGGRVLTLKDHMLHDSYGSMHEYFEKLNRYTTAGARELDRRGRKASTAQVVFRLPLTFLKEYLLKKNILNGYPGFVWSLFSAMYPVVKYAKLHELQQKRPSPEERPVRMYENRTH
ncbi:glycosyltransferase [Rudanella paleaurantiibacter]|uniref:Glycosyltransferase n=1 Tax=Rudanella paleaurantiibacter TaxID=2614655 RepID=A0A7J5U1B2_9BACT|nr:glycosyltransferase family 2 protein [Rudanella paleaurantiibacter]KAB7731594.1 glycosyltransferase [Rudanella paleaurantiibacter]